MIVILIYAVKNCPATGLIEHWLHLEAALTSASLPGFSDTMYDSPLSNFEGEDRGSFKLSPTARRSWRHACPGTGRMPDALAKTHDKHDQVTTLLGVSRATPRRKMKEIGLDD